MSTQTEIPTETRQSSPALPPKNGRFAGYANLLLARMKELQREPEVIFWVFAFPLLLAFGLGIAFRNKPADLTHVVIVAGPVADRVTEMLNRAPSGQHIQADILPREEALNRFRFGKYDLVISEADNGEVSYRYDPARPESVLARSIVDDALQEAAGRTARFATHEVPTSEPGARYIDFLIPGLLGMNLMNSGMWGIGFALVEMRQRKLLKRFMATPMRRTDFLAALISSRLVLMIVELVLLIGFGIIVFKMRVMGSWLSMLLVSALGAISFGCVGLLTASRAQKIETASGLINLVMMPMWIFSGVFFSYERFPAAVQPFIKALPLTALNDALRSTILEGAPLSHQGWRLLVLGVWCVVSFVLALRWFRWT
jgi:ABC-type multidrug transport system permease subunit